MCTFPCVHILPNLQISPTSYFSVAQLLAIHIVSFVHCFSCPFLSEISYRSHRCMGKWVFFSFLLLRLPPLLQWTSRGVNTTFIKTRPGQSAARGPHTARKPLLSGPRTVLNIKTIYSFLSKVDQLLIFNIPQKISLVFVKINKFKIKTIITSLFHFIFK